MTQTVIKTCEWCGAEFSPGPFNAHKARFCSAKCRRAGYAESETKKHYVFTCRNCGCEYATPYANRDQYCSRDCAFKAHKQWLKTRPAKARECPSCGGTFANSEGGYGSRVYCSRECARRGVPKICGHCGQTYYGSPASKYCCGDCTYGANLAMRRAEYVPAPERLRQCRWCGAEFHTSKPGARYCGSACSKRAMRAAKSAQFHRYKVRKRGQFVARVVSLAIFNRDHWTCGICGGPVDPSIDYPDPMSRSLDHIIPISRGGTHEPRNVRLTHWICNCTRGDTTLL